MVGIVVRDGISRAEVEGSVQGSGCNVCLRDVQGGSVAFLAGLSKVQRVQEQGSCEFLALEGRGCSHS